VYDAMRVEYADLYGRLEKAGFLQDFGADDSGVFMKFLRRGRATTSTWAPRSW
jgi:putative flavoprotein involved in K+ transport